MRIACVALIVLGMSVIAAGQISPEEAYQKLQQKQKEKQHAPGRGAGESSATTQPAGADAPAPAARGGGMAEAKLLHQGWDAVGAKHYAFALAFFERAIAADPADPNALMGHGVCKYELKEYKAAGRDMEKAYKLADVGGPGRVSRQLVIAACAADVMNDNPMRAVKLLRGLMEPMEQNDRLDEELQNDLGIALSHADAQAKKLPMFDEALKYYLAYDKKLNAQRKDGTARWGTKWIPTEEAEADWKKYQTASDRTQQASIILDHISLAREHAHDHYLELHGMRLHGTEEIKRYMNEYKQALIDEAKARQQLQKSVDKLNAVEKPPFPDRIEHDWQEPR
jgi:tetratricopeptide (TPR) repeat protein